MPRTKLPVKERNKKDREKLQDIYNNYVLSTIKVHTLEKRKNATICFNGSYDELTQLIDIKIDEMKEVERELKKERRTLLDLWYKYKSLKHRVDNQIRLDKMKEEIKEMKKEELSLAKENKKLSTAFNMNMLDRLPLELVDIIKSFIPYEIRNTLIEEKKPFRLFKNLTPCTLKSFLMNICFTAEYFTLLTDDEKQQQIYKPGNTLTWRPEWFEYVKRDELETKIKHIFHTFKKSCPKGAYKLMRMFLVLINPDKKYNNYDSNWFRLTSIPL